MDDIFKGIAKTLFMAKLTLAVMGLMIIGLIFSQFQLTNKISDLSEKRPVMVIPGAAAGVYTPGLAKENVVNVARYLSSLATNFTPQTMAKKYEELRSYMAPSYLTDFDVAKNALAKEVQVQLQSRAFVADPGGDKLTGDENQGYVFESNGVWTFYSGSLVMNSVHSTILIHFQTIAADKDNPYGVQIRRIELRSGDAIRQETQETSPVTTQQPRAN